MYATSAALSAASATGAAARISTRLAAAGFAAASAGGAPAAVAAAEASAAPAQQAAWLADLKRDACAKLGSFSLEGCEIHTTGQPCPMCLGAIHWARIRKIYYGFRIEDAAEIGFDDSEFFRQMTLPPEQRDIPSLELCREEALVLAREYAALPDKRHY